jgi:hypothetical protein
MPQLSKSRFARALVSRRALFILGAGTSVPMVPIASKIAEHVADVYWAGGSFPVEIPQTQDERALRIIDAAGKVAPVSPLDCDLRLEVVSRMSSGFVQSALRQIIGAHRYRRDSPSNYSVFRLFPPSVIWNYNLDGLAERFCRDRHRVLNAHGTVPFPFGSKVGLEFVRAAQDYDLPARPTGELLLEPERLNTQLALPWHLGSCDFVVLIGYTFGRNGDTLDDTRSFEHLSTLLARTPRPTVVAEPFPEFTANMLADRIKSNCIYEAPIFWNVFASALIDIACEGKNLNKIEKAYDLIGNTIL